eukprot:32138-Pyramimonas_sp.AAC.1
MFAFVSWVAAAGGAGLELATRLLADGLEERFTAVEAAFDRYRPDENAALDQSGVLLLLLDIMPTSTRQ